MAKAQPSVGIAEHFSARAAARLSGLTVDMVNYLCRHEIVVASGSKARGRGTARKYTFADILLLRVLAQLLGQGVSVLGLRKSLAVYRKRAGQADLASCRYFVTDGYNVYLQDEGRLENLTSGQQAFAFVLDMQPIRKKVLQEIEQIGIAMNG